MTGKLDAAYWSSRYQNRQTGWDLGQASPALVTFTEQNFPKDTRILLPGAGNAWEAEHLFHAGYTNITVLDISPEPLAALQERVPGFPAQQLVCADFFEHTGSYGLVLEQTFFCALDPQLRSAYARKMWELLAVDGILAGLWFGVEFDGGPPFGGSLEEYLRYFEPYFSCEEAGVAQNSVKPRAGNELFMRWRRKTR